MRPISILAFALTISVALAKGSKNKPSGPTEAAATEAPEDTIDESETDSSSDSEVSTSIYMLIFFVIIFYPKSVLPCIIEIILVF